MKNKLLLIVSLICYSTIITAQKREEHIKKRILDLEAKIHMGHSDSSYVLSQEKILSILKAHYKQLELVQQLEGYEIFKFNFLKNKGHQFKRVRLYKESNKYYRKALAYYDKAAKVSHDEYSVDKAFRTYGQMAFNNIALGNKDSAYVNYKNGVIFSEKNIQRRILKASALNNLGMFCTEQINQQDSAIYYLERAQKEIGAITDEEFKAFDGSIRDNIAKAYIGKENIAKAKELYLINFYFFNPNNYKKRYKDYYRWIRSGIQVAEMNIKLKESELAKIRLDSAHVLLKKFTNFIDHDKLKLRMYKAYKDLAILNNNSNLEDFYWRKIIACSDTIKRKKKKIYKNWSLALQSVEFKELEKELKKKDLALKNKKADGINIYLIVGSILAIGMVYMIYKTHDRFM